MVVSFHLQNPVLTRIVCNQYNKIMNAVCDTQNYIHVLVFLSPPRGFDNVVFHQLGRDSWCSWSHRAAMPQFSELSVLLSVHLSILLPPRFHKHSLSSRPSTHSCHNCTTHSLCRWSRHVYHTHGRHTHSTLQTPTSLGDCRYTCHSDRSLFHCI